MRKTVCDALRGALLLLLVAPAATALPGSPSERAKTFATCSGRLWALATRQNATHDPQYRETDAIRADFDLLLDATLPAALDHGLPEGMDFHWRIGGWVETAALLADVYYSFDEDRAQRAAQALEARIDRCRALILSSN